MTLKGVKEVVPFIVCGKEWPLFSVEVSQLHT